jgi:hypothetical protein
MLLLVIVQMKRWDEYHELQQILKYLVHPIVTVYPLTANSTTSAWVNPIFSRYYSKLSDPSIVNTLENIPKRLMSLETITFSPASSFFFNYFKCNFQFSIDIITELFMISLMLPWYFPLFMNSNLSTGSPNFISDLLLFQQNSFIFSFPKSCSKSVFPVNKTVNIRGWFKFFFFRLLKCFSFWICCSNLYGVWS